VISERASIAALLPMVAYFGAAALFTPPDEEAYSNARNSLSEQLNFRRLRSDIPSSRTNAQSASTSSVWQGLGLPDQKCPIRPVVVTAGKNDGKEAGAVNCNR
jgi:hypothetical protein